MHPEVVSDEPGHCPKCQMKLLPAQLVGEAGAATITRVTSTKPTTTHAAGGIEWEDDMVDVNRITTPRTCAGS